MSKVNQIIDTGKMLRSKGVKYRLGAKALPPVIPSHLDCSGFVRYCFRAAGINIPDGTYRQYHFSKEITAKDLKVGDIGFIQHPSTAGTNHIGIYVGGKQWMHCNFSRNGITIEATKMFDKHLRRIEIPEEAKMTETTRRIVVSDKERGYAETAIQDLADAKLIGSPAVHLNNLKTDPSNWAIWVAMASIARKAGLMK